MTLIKDVYKAPRLKNQLLCWVTPPEWNHTKEHKNASLSNIYDNVKWFSNNRLFKNTKIWLNLSNNYIRFAT